MAYRRDYLIHELDHYRERWRATDRVINQRLTLLITALGAAIAGTAALLSREPSGTPLVASASVLTVIWAILAVVSQGLFVRLVRARLSICRSIRIINLLRSQLPAYTPPRDRAVLRTAYHLDGDPPKPFALLNSCGAAALIQAAATLAALSFYVAGATYEPPMVAFAAALALLVGNMAVYALRCQAPLSNVKIGKPRGYG